MKVEEIKPRASEGDTIELEGKVSFAQKPREGQYGWSQFIGVKDDTGEQNCWIRLEGEEDKVTKGTSIKIKGKLGEEYKDKRTKEMVRSINGCDFEVVGKMQEPAQSSGKSSAQPKGNGGDREGYWEKKFIWDQKVHFSIVRECAIKAVTELAKADILPPSKNFLKEYFKMADEIVNYICRKKLTSEDITRELGGTKEETKEERIEEVEEIVGETRFKPASTEQKKYIYGYRNNEDKWCKGIVESRYIKKPEIREIGDPKKLSLEDASEWLLWWWGPNKKTGERAKREKENPIDEVKESGSIVKGNKTSLVKDDLVDDINAWRRENFLSDDKKFKEELGYNPKLEELSEEDLLKIKKLIKNYHPKSWNGDK